MVWCKQCYCDHANILCGLKEKTVIDFEQEENEFPVQMVCIFDRGFKYEVFS